MRCAILVLALAAFLPASLPAAQNAPPADGIGVLLSQIEQALVAGNPEAYRDLLATGTDAAAARAFAQAVFRPGITKATLRERDRVPLTGAVEGEGYRLLVEALVERGRAGRVVTWRFDVRRSLDNPDKWFIASQEQLSSIEGLYRLKLDTSRAFAAHDLTISAIDYTLKLPRGSVFVAESDAGVTVLLLVGRGALHFSPGPAAERRQVRIFCGSDTLDSPFDTALVRLNPADYTNRVLSSALAAGPADQGQARTAQEFFDAQVGQSFAIGLNDLSSETWSLTPGMGDFVADVRTRKQGVLTYTRSSSEAEDITLFDRRRRKNISVYASPQNLASRGRFYNEDDFADYDVRHYDVDVAFSPDRQWIDGKVTLDLKIRTEISGALTLRLADSLVVKSISSPEIGRLSFFRVLGQHSVVVNLPVLVHRDQLLSLAVTYAGVLDSQPMDRETIEVAQEVNDMPLVTPEQRFLYSNRSYWYPQSPVSGYATATIRVVVPEGLACVASGELRETHAASGTDRDARRREFVFDAPLPVRYLAVVISKFLAPSTTAVPLNGMSATPTRVTARAGQPEAGAAGVLKLVVTTNPRQDSRGRSLAGAAARIIQFYSSLTGDTPYPSITLALTESELPEGHSPAYLAVLSQPTLMSNASWRNDPVNFDNYPSFFLAHELAHQWWGQAVGWENYHEQWISEGFAQYFAALYARQERGEDSYLSMLRQMRRTAASYASQGPIWLGYRLGHIRNDSRVRRAIIYNKAAVVLDMLRRLIGDEAFFRGLRRFYAESRFKKVGTDNARKAFEAESGETLDRFFDGWIFSADLPAVRITRQIVTGENGPALKLVFEQVQPELFDFVIPLAIRYMSGKSELQEVRVRERSTEVVVPLSGQLRAVDADPDHITLAEFQ